MIRHTRTPPRKRSFRILGVAIISLLLALGAFYFSSSWSTSLITLGASFILLSTYALIQVKLAQSARIKKMELVFPDFLQLMASNLRAGLTIDRALLMSSREEFAPLDEEILALGKNLVTGKEIDRALKEMAAKINSEKIRKALGLIISGLRSGGNIAVLLEETATNMRERTFIEKRAASNVLMYEIFIFFAVAVGAPVLFGLSVVLVEVLTNVLGDIPALDTATRLPFALTKVNVSITFITYFALVFLTATSVLGSLVLGIVTKGEEKAGLRYMLPLIVVAIAVFLFVRIFLAGYFADFFG